jgi:nicotinamidase-related amidase
MVQHIAREKQSWDSFVLLLIDVQMDFWTDEIAAAFPDYQNRVTRLLAYCRQESIDIVHLRAGFSADQSDWMVKYRFLDSIPCIEGTDGAEVLPFAAELPGETVFVKNTFDGFLSAKLQSYLQKNKKQFVLVAGIETSVCVLLTAASAAQRGYLVAVVEDCCADQPDVHEHTLDRYPFIFSRTTVDQIDATRAQWLADLERLANK